MYLHIGNGKNVRLTSIVGIFDTDTATIAKNTKNYLSVCQRRGEVICITDDIPKSFILTEEKGEKKVYLSQLSAKTLCARVDDFLAL